MGELHTVRRALSADLHGMLRVLWSYGEGGFDLRPDHAGAEGATEPLRALPSLTAGRFLVSDAASPQVARILTSHNGIRGRRTALQRRVVAGYVRAGLPRRLVGERLTLVGAGLTDDTLAAVSFPAHLRERLQEPHALLGIGVRRVDDPHAKPTIQLYTPGGQPRGYAKLGWTPQSAVMVRNEANALRRVSAGMGRVRAPRLLDTGEWAGHPYLVVEPLPDDVRALPGQESPRWASRSIAGQLSRVSLAGSTWLALLRRRLAVVGHGSSGLASAAHRALTVLAHTPAPQWQLGAWHGDWTWWNVARSSDVVYAWDWEHADECAPFGFDDLHWSISVDCELGGKTLEDALSRARPCVPSDVRDEGLFQLGYLTEMAVRSCEVSRFDGGPPEELHPGLQGALARRT